jgi:hypothetical protein
MTATVEADIVVVTAPEVRKARRAADPPGTEREFGYVVAHGHDGTRHELWATSEPAKAALAKLGKGDPASVRGELAGRRRRGDYHDQRRIVRLALGGLPATESAGQGDDDGDACRRRGRRSRMARKNRSRISELSSDLKLYFISANQSFVRTRVSRV